MPRNWTCQGPMSPPEHSLCSRRGQATVEKQLVRRKVGHCLAICHQRRSPASQAAHKRLCSSVDHHMGIRLRKTLVCSNPISPSILLSVCFQSDLTFPCGSLVPDTSANRSSLCTGLVKFCLLRLTLSNPPRLSYSPPGNPARYGC